MFMTRRQPIASDAVRDFIDAFNRDFAAASFATPVANEMGFPMDISESKGELVIRANLPGFRREDIQVHLQNGILTIEAQRTEERESRPTAAAKQKDPGGEGEHFYRRERITGNVVRRVELPSRFIDTDPAASLDHGVLTLRFPESPSSKPRQISIV